MGSLSPFFLPRPSPLRNIYYRLYLEMVKICHVSILLEISQKSQLQDFFFPIKKKLHIFFSFKKQANKIVSLEEGRSEFSCSESS